MRKIKFYFSDKSFIASTIIGLCLLVISCIINFYAGTFATNNASNYVTDIILDNIPVYDVDGTFIYGPFVMWLFVAYLCLKEPNRIPFLLKSIALFVCIRSLFVILTHIGPFPDGIIISTPKDFISKFTFGGDLFFSAHTGLPFLMALLFSKSMFLRILFTITAIFFGCIVLMAHLHYSIDVLSAFFITYTIFAISKTFFKSDWKLFNRDFSAG